MIVVVAAAGHFGTTKLRSRTYEVGDTYLVADRTIEVVPAMKQQQASPRGFMLTGYDTYSYPYRNTVRQVANEMAHEKSAVMRAEISRGDFGTKVSETTIVSTSALVLMLASLLGWYVINSMDGQMGSTAAIEQSSSGEFPAAVHLHASGSNVPKLDMNFEPVGDATGTDNDLAEETNIYALSAATKAEGSEGPRRTSRRRSRLVARHAPRFFHTSAGVVRPSGPS